MVKLDKIYTRGGDTGLTSLGNGDRVKKDSLRVKSYGEVDEINAIIGVVTCYCSDNLKKNLRHIQNELFDIGAILCVPEKKNNTEAKNFGVLSLENEIDKMNSKLSDLKWPPSPELMDKYDLGQRPLKDQRRPEKLLREIGHHPYRAKQPNGWSDISEDWLSPELLIRRLVYADRSYSFLKAGNDNKEFYEKIINNNFDNPGKILDYVFKNMLRKSSEKNVLIFNHPEFLKA